MAVVFLYKDPKPTSNHMKAKSYLIVCLTASALATFAQQPQPPRPGTPPSAPAPGQSFSERGNQIGRAADATPAPALTRFNLDFPGGTPKQLVAAIEKATGKPLNAIVPEEFAGTELPPLKMNGVDVSKLFKALEISSYKTVPFISGTYIDGSGTTRSTYQQSSTSYGFRTDGPLSDDSIWYFRVDAPNLPPASPGKASRFYSLAPYLDRGLTVDDITTAIETGWKMQGYGASQPKISFHKETKLLIAVGEPTRLETIDAVLKALSIPEKKPAIDPTTGLPLPKADLNIEQK